jgi:hypothetical protein
MRRTLVAALAALAMTGVVAGPVDSAIGSQHASMAKPCSAGWKHAVIGGSHKCLRRGQFCARSRDREYRRYGYRCYKSDTRGSYHLT